MTTTVFLGACLLALLTIPALIPWRVTLSKEKKAARLRAKGWTWKQVADRLGTSETSAARWAKLATA